jgi:predicted phosphoribosyltransferase
MTFRDRMEAGERLAAVLKRFQGQPCVVLALPRGGVPVAKPIAEALRAPLDLVLVRKIGVPWQPELAMGAVVDGPRPMVVRNEEVIRFTGASEADFSRIRDAELAEIARRRAVYVGGRPHPDIAGRIAIVVDDGVATGATTRAALRAVRQRHPAKLVLAVPVGPTDTLRELAGEADEIVCLETYDAFDAIGAYYDNFEQVGDAAVKEILAALPS